MDYVHHQTIDIDDYGHHHYGNDHQPNIR